MKKWEEMSTNQIVIEVATLKEMHEATKREILTLVDKMEKIEKEFHEGNNIIHNRLNNV